MLPFESSHAVPAQVQTSTFGSRCCWSVSHWTLLFFRFTTNTLWAEVMAANLFVPLIAIFLFKLNNRETDLKVVSFWVENFWFQKFEHHPPLQVGSATHLLLARFAHRTDKLHFAVDQRQIDRIFASKRCGGQQRVEIAIFPNERTVYDD